MQELIVVPAEDGTKRFRSNRVKHRTLLIFERNRYFSFRAVYHDPRMFCNDRMWSCTHPNTGIFRSFSYGNDANWSSVSRDATPYAQLRSSETPRSLSSCVGHGCRPSLAALTATPLILRLSLKKQVGVRGVAGRGEAVRGTEVGGTLLSRHQLRHLPGTTPLWGCSRALPLPR